jgi:Lon-like ATP-dependent protease
MHVPEGAIKKDGPSAGCTMVTAMLSLALNQPVRDNLAMTGEISLKGKASQRAPFLTNPPPPPPHRQAMPIGGVKEKVIAARRAGVQAVVLPKGNQKDYEELPQYLKEDLQATFADTYDDVFAVAFTRK